jgi:hypothetical protein
MKTVKNRAYSFEHMKQRLQERYGLSITQEEYDTICKNTKIVNGVLEIMGEKKQKICKIQFKGKLETIVYSLGCDYITTVLPPK